MVKVTLTLLMCLCGIRVFVVADDGKSHYEYCVIGAGPGGLQMAYFLQNAGRDYVVFEKGHCAGTFYTKFPIHRTLISINKRNTGQTNKEFNLRHDWNSLISHDESLRMGVYSKDFFPDADLFVKYLNDFVHKLAINVKFNTTIENLRNKDPVDNLFHIKDQHDNEYTCSHVIVATGIAKANVPDNDALKKYMINYPDLSLDLEEYEGKSVLILGRGNSGFETAQYIIGRTNFIHMIGKSRVRLAWSTHYVGDLRAVNDGLVDTYQLKSLDAISIVNVEKLLIRRSAIDGRFYIDIENVTKRRGMDIDNNYIRSGYDMIIGCLGFKFDKSIFNEKSIHTESLHFKKYPKMTYQYESTNIPGVFFAGTVTHALDFRLSAGGFIHGFRYTARTLHRILENRYHNVAWPSVQFQSAIEVIPHLMKRLNEASDIYQMFGVLCEVIIFSEDDSVATYLEAYPCRLVSQIPQVTGHSVPGKLVIAAMEYGKNASGPGKDVLRENNNFNATIDAHLSNFLHPILYYFKTMPTESSLFNRPKKWILPIPDRIHHIVEDFTSLFDGPTSHVLPVRRFFETILGRDLRQYYVEQCMAASLVSATLPESCKMYDMKGQGASPTKTQKENLEKMDPWLVQRMGVYLK